MGLDRERLLSIASALYNECEGQPFVFCYDDASFSPLVAWSRALPPSKLPHTGVVNVMQRLMYRKAPNPIFKCFYHGVQGFSPACTGMLSFLNAREPERIDDFNKERFTLLDLQKKYEYLEIAEATTRTEALDSFMVGNLGPAPDVRLDTGDDAKRLHRVYMMVAFALAATRAAAYDKPAKTIPGNHSPGHPIAALLVSRTGDLLSFGLNTTPTNHTFHAEMNAIQAYCKIKGNIPSGARIYTTLQPCLMCAGMIRHTMPDDLVVYYAMKDAAVRASALSNPSTCLVRLGQGGVKAMRAYEKPWYSPSLGNAGRNQNRTEDLSDKLDKNNGEEVAFLKKGDGKGLIQAAKDSLQRKITKYSKGKERDPSGKRPRAAVRRVLIHLSPFIVSQGLFNFSLNVLTQEQMDELDAQPPAEKRQKV